jgi:outer membrane protein insertion porin family
MIKNFYTIIILFLFSSYAHAEIVKKVIINGNKRVTNETIQVYGKIEINKNYSEADLNGVLNNIYSTEFFEDVDLSISENILNITVKEYPIINQLILIGEKKKAYEEEIKKLIKLKEKKSFIKSYLSKDIEVIKKLYSSLGYNFADVNAKVREIDSTNLDLLIEIKRGDRTKVSTINFLGNKNFKSKRLRDVIASEEDKFWKFLSKNTNLSENLINLDKRLLINYYKSMGFYDVKISSNIAKINQTGNADLIYTVNEGIRYTINKISTNIDSVFDKKIFFPLNKIFNKHVGSYYSPFKVKKLLDEIDVLIENNNLQFVEHNVQESIEGESINIIFNVFEGEKKLVERINIVGNNITDERVIRGELLIDEGDPLTNLKLDKSIAELKARRIFKDIKYNIVDGSKDNLKIIDINVEEQSTGEISAGAGIGTSGGSVAFSIKENNWLGEGKSLGFDIQLDQESLAGTFTYYDPNYDFLGNSISYSLSSEKNDKPTQGYENNVISASVGTGFEQYKNVDVVLRLNASYDDLRTQDSASASLKTQAGTFSEFGTNYGFTLDNRDRAFMPTSGSLVTFNQSLPFYADKRFIGNTFSTSLYKALNENVIGSSKLFLTSINGLGDDDVRLSKRRGLSNKRLRGFAKSKVGPVDGTDHIGGNYAAAANFEANLPKLLPEDTNADASIFLDIGNVWGVDYSSLIEDSNKIRSSTGINIGWASPIGPISFVFAQNLTKASTDETESFSFNLGTTF